MEKTLKTLNFLRQEGSKDFQERVPVATQENIKEVGNAILEHPGHTNEFITNLINKIALTEVLSPNVDSVFGEFIGPDLVAGDTIESIFVNMAKSEAFKGDTLEDGDSIDPFKVKKPAVEVAYHRVDRKVYYHITVQEVNIKNAFNNTAKFNEFVQELIISLSNAVKRDLLVDGKELLDRDGKDGKKDIYGKKYELGEFTDGREMAAAISKSIKDATTYMPFISKDFNSSGVETDTPTGSMVIFMRADVKNLIETDLLSGVYNPEMYGAGVQIKVIDEFLDGEQVAAILDKRHLKINHSLNRTTHQENALALYTNYFSHVHRLVSYNPFGNAVKISAKLTELTE